MPVIAAGIVCRNGRILVARCFMDVSRIRIEGLLSAFPKLLGKGNRQVTNIESGSVRYLYQPVEEMYLVLVTTKQSNIMEDVATMRLMGRAIPEYCPDVSEEGVVDKAFEIMFAFDEMVTNGTREAQSMEQVVVALEMHSEAEERAQREHKEKVADATKVAKAKAKELRAKKMEMEGSMSAGGPSFPMPDTSSNADAHRRTYSDTAQEVATKPAKKPGIGGMSLGNKRKQDHASKVMQESGAPAVAATAPAPAESGDVVAEQAVTLKIDEKVSAALNRDGGVSAVDIRGDMFINVTDAEFTLIRIHLTQLASDFTFKTHPNINKQLFSSDNVLAIRDGRPYPTHQALGILRWRAQALSGTKLPITINCWPSDSGASVEFELENPNVTLLNVTIALPLAGAFPSIESISVGSFRHDSGNSVLHWQIPQIDKNESSGVMEVELDKPVGEQAFFPASVAFAARSCLAGVAVADVVHIENGSSVPYSATVTMQSDEYIVE